MSKESEEVLAALCSAVEYLLDRDGEIDSIDACMTHIRYTGRTSLPHFDVIAGDKIIRIDATEIGTHTHTFRSDGQCECGEYNEDEDTDLDARTTAEIKVHRVQDLFPQ